MRERRSFTKSFKAEAVRLLEQSSKPAAELARELGVPRNRLYKWQAQIRTHGEHSFPGSGRLPAPADDVARLRRENARLREERDILKKAVVGSTGQSNTIYSNVAIKGWCVWHKWDDQGFLLPRKRNCGKGGRAGSL